MKILTIDWEEWFHILDHASTDDDTAWSNFTSRIERNTIALLEDLSESKQRATFFCVGWVANKFPHLVRQIAAAGHSVGSHSHLHRLIYRLTPTTFRDDLKTSISVLEDIVGSKVRAHRAPGFSLNRRTPWAIEMLTEYGIEFDSSVACGHHAHGGTAHIDLNRPGRLLYGGSVLKEFPVVRCGARTPFFPGGGYFRLLPYRLLRTSIESSSYTNTYFHPRDFDSDQPIIPNLSIVRSLKMRLGLKNSRAKFRKLLSDFEFIDIPTAADRVDWDSSTAIKM